MDIKDKKYKEMCVMMYSMWTLHYREISLAETLQASLGKLLEWYDETKNPKLTELIELHLQAYVNTGNALHPETEVVGEALRLLNND